jgi:hypothetical protein
MGSMYTPGDISSLNAYRSEVMGLLAISVTLKVLACCSRAPPHTIIACDGKAALQTLHESRDSISYNSPHADLKSAMVDLWTTMETIPYTVHVLGHQDDQKQQQLSRLEEMNILVDKLATLTALDRPPQIYTWAISGMGLPHVSYSGRQINGEMVHQLVDNLCTDRLHEYLAQRVPTNPQDMQLWHSEAFAHARSQAPLGTVIQ